jgi:predicted RNA-binding protein YlqC (UPF0109 family)
VKRRRIRKRRAHNNAFDNDSNIRMHVLKRHVGRIIGRGGSTTEDIKCRSGAL